MKRTRVIPLRIDENLLREIDEFVFRSQLYGKKISRNKLFNDVVKKALEK